MNKIEVLYAAIFDNLSIGVCVYDIHGNFLYVNSTMVKWRKISLQQYVSMNVHDFYNNDAISNCVFDIVLQERKTVSRLQYYQNVARKENERQLRIVTGVPIFDKSGNIQNVITYLQDVNDFNNLYHQLTAEKKMISSTMHSEQHLGKYKIIAESQEMKALLDLADNVAETDSTILLYGESGTGKEVIAHYIRNQGSRKSKPFIEVNCAAFAESLLESELFGYEKGTFTGALNTGKAGLIEAADGGTLFLDEINSLPLNLQSKFLRVIGEKCTRRIGSEKSKKVDFRLIAATNVNLIDMVQERTFRIDLYYRLNVVPITIPPLREREDDIVPLCNFFIKEFSEQYGMKKQFSESALQWAVDYDWPGNVRELRNFVERVVIMTPRDISIIENLPNELLDHGMTNHVSTPHKKRKLTKLDVMNALKVCGENRAMSAQYLGISRRTLQYKIREFRLPTKK